MIILLDLNTCYCYATIYVKNSYNLDLFYHCSHLLIIWVMDLIGVDWSLLLGVFDPKMGPNPWSLSLYNTNLYNTTLFELCQTLQNGVKVSVSSSWLRVICHCSVYLQCLRHCRFLKIKRYDHQVIFHFF